MDITLFEQKIIYNPRNRRLLEFLARYPYLISELPEIKGVIDLILPGSYLQLVYSECDNLMIMICTNREYEDARKRFKILKEKWYNELGHFRSRHFNIMLHFVD